MLTVLLFVAVLFKVFHVENVLLCTYLAFVLLSRLTIAIRVGNAKARSSAVFIDGKSKHKRWASVSIDATHWKQESMSFAKLSRGR